jgi:putative membrane protein
VTAGSRVPQLCLGIYVGCWTALAIAPLHRGDWLLENLPVFVAVPIAVWLHRRAPLSDRAYVQITIFLLLHAVGSHYTYSEVPVGHWARDAFGLSRNHYDRVVHFAFGLLMLRPISELAFRNLRGDAPLARRYLAVAAVALWSAVYEIVEWLVASVADPEAGIAYLGTQGDVWDAQKDTALACLGAVLAMAAPRSGPSAPEGRPEHHRAAREGDGARPFGQ